MSQGVYGRGLSWAARLFAIASLLVVGKSEVWGAQHAAAIDHNDRSSAMAEDGAGVLTYVEVGDADSESDDNPPLTE